MKSKGFIAALTLVLAAFLLNACTGTSSSALPKNTPPRSTSRAAETTLAPSATPLPTTTASQTPTSTPSPTITPTPSPSPSPTPAYETFRGTCKEASAPGLCFKSWGWGVYSGKRMLRYVFLHARYPDALKLRINGTQLTCEAAPDYGEGGVVCYGLPLGTISGEVRLDFAYFLPNGDVISGKVPPEIKPKLRYWFKVYYPPTPTPTPAG